ncbi:hypothetical protein BEWA_012780 [Theileria equi strain WA]|uniref:Uncharacterized protein n=1 Tax=Theileria equi strain WA TaxID=1537102 RepID=L1LBR9_THEEQ|nr:hypothetical protein BEWA_012780 [Theileria equi strain WA]EKX72719.1 hypothetical protein BEWA_012780 [Theileria equi strain WA]|eukprot:XP_004832171.1 hypothetical protein BEWA_012780 [Theileria equi strain WA]
MATLYTCRGVHQGTVQDGKKRPLVRLTTEDGSAYYYANPSGVGTRKQVGKYCNEKSCQGDTCQCNCRSGGGGPGACQPEKCTSSNCQCCKDKDGGAISSFNTFTSQSLMTILAFTGDGYLKTYSKYEHDRDKWPTGSGHGYSCSKNSTHDTDSKKRPTQSILPTHLSKGEYRDSYTKVYSSVLHFTMDTVSNPTIVALYNSMLRIS